MSKIKYYLKRLVGLWPPSKDSSKRLMYELKKADEEYSGDF